MRTPKGPKPGLGSCLSLIREIEVFDEPELEFGAQISHIDIRFGIMNYGPLDLGSESAPNRIRIGAVGTPETIEGTVRWLETCRQEIPAKESNQPNLFPRFPGFATDQGFRSTLVIEPQLQRSVAGKVFDDIVKVNDNNKIVEGAVRIIHDEFKVLVESSKVDVLVCAVPPQLVTLMDPDTRPRPANPTAPVLSFHDLLKARCMDLRKPVQLILPGTFDPKQARKQKIKGVVRPLQDAATRAWNFHTALYYKAGGRPWRLVRDVRKVSTCFVGISFYKSLDRSAVLTSVAQVFDERGDGLVVRGGTATWSKEDRTSHLSETDAYALLRDALQRYRQEHSTWPARVVVHKTSKYSPDELKGMQRAQQEVGLEFMDCISLSREASTRLLRQGRYPVLRGAFWSLDDNEHFLSTRGSVDFYQTYPGLYIPRPLVFRGAQLEQTPRVVAQELLALTKMNWNDTQFDGADPITITAARRVGDILKYIGPDDSFEPRYSFYM
jgi:hypothetical protein